MELTRTQRIKNRVFDCLDGAPDGDLIDKTVYLALLMLIVVTTAAVMYESLPEVKADPILHARLNHFERISLWIFAVEYVLRLWSCPAHVGSYHLGRLKLARHPAMLIDLLALMPLWAPLIGYDIRRNPLTRSVRVFRMLKLAQYLPGTAVVARVVRSRARELVACVGYVGLVLICASTVLYFCEHAAQPDKFTSIPHTMWWGIVTLTTVGYGDLYPVTALGKALGGVFAVLGVLTFALPTAILGSAFLEEWQRHGHR